VSSELASLGCALYWGVASWGVLGLPNRPGDMDFLPTSSRVACRLCVVVTLVAVGLGVAGGYGASTARADLVNVGPCNGSGLTQPFLRWLDPSWYELAPGGDFESAAWFLSGDAQLVSGSDPYAATGSLGSQSLSLPTGSWAESPVTCVDAAYPSIRFFIEGVGSVAAGLIYQGTYIPTGVAVAGGEWQPTPVMVTDSSVAGLLSGGSAPVSVRVTALSGHPEVDDIFIDPWNRG
jgi:hypothetical protein